MKLVVEEHELPDASERRPDLLYVPMVAFEGHESRPIIGSTTKRANVEFGLIEQFQIRIAYGCAMAQNECTSPCPLDRAPEKKVESRSLAQ